MHEQECCMLAAKGLQRREDNSHPSMAPSVYKSNTIEVQYPIIYRNQSKLYRTTMIHVFPKRQSSTDLHAIIRNSGKPNASAKIHASQYRAPFALSVSTTQRRQDTSHTYMENHVIKSPLIGQSQSQTKSVGLLCM